MKRTMLSVFLAVQVLLLAFAGNILSPLISPETGDLIGIAFMSPFILGSLALVIVIAIGVYIYAKIKKESWLKIVEIVFLFLDLMLAAFFLVSMKII